MKWDRITEPRHLGCETCGVRTVYWRLATEETAPAVGWLAVKRNPDGSGWVWKYRRAPRRHTGGDLLAGGIERTVDDAKAAAERSARLRRRVPLRMPIRNVQTSVAPEIGRFDATVAPDGTHHEALAAAGGFAAWNARYHAWRETCKASASAADETA